MNDKELRDAFLDYQKRYGTPTTFIASRCGVSREHLSRWLHNDSYVISSELKTKIKSVIKGKMLK
ncbi:hypothetical protein [Candidatus Pristimantibacillus sp. PTI5]|uniref:hypothetical protein n=1 Tax=Candidatus Pristimantibacillus sp. PTI5 TaxID=3400422 RepID=UPI003B01EB56